MVREIYAMETWQIIVVFLVLGLTSWFIVLRMARYVDAKDESIKPGDVFAARDLRHKSVTLYIVDVHEGRIVYEVDNGVHVVAINETEDIFKSWWPDRVRLPGAPARTGIGRASIRSSRSPFG